MPKTIHFSSMAQYHEYANRPAPEHPLLSVTSFSQNPEVNKSCPDSPPMSTDFYIMKIVRVLSGEMTYGRTRYDFSDGTMKFIAPNQLIHWENVIMEPWGYALMFHKDYLRGHGLETEIRKYGFFSYSVNESLHLSPREEKTALSIFETIYGEYVNNPDEFSREIILSQIRTLLKYSDRFYKRQFQDRKVLNTELGERFETLMRDYFESGGLERDGAPGVDWAARELDLTPRYLSDCLKSETGKTAKEHIHLFLLDQAKSLLLSPGMNVSETAYRLGFEYPQYFSRLFKKKMGMSPREYRKRNMVQ